MVRPERRVVLTGESPVRVTKEPSSVEGPRGQGCTDRLHRRAEGIPASGGSSISGGARATLHRGFATDFALERFDPKKAPVLYRPTCLISNPCSGTKRVALDPLTGQIASAALLGGPSYVPGTGGPVSGSITAKDPNYPNGSIENAGERFQ